MLPIKVKELIEDYEKYVLNGNIFHLEEEGYVLFQKEQKDIALYYFKDNLGKLVIHF